jgi:DNA processing protein
VNDELLYSIALISAPGVGNINARKLVAYAGSAKAVFTDKRKKLTHISGIGETVVAGLGDQSLLQQAEKEVNFIIKHNINVLQCTDKAYPERLKNCGDSPFLLFMKGDVDLNKRKIISIVGTRKATDYGRELCNQLIAAFKERGHDVLICSGLAYGVDILAHKACLKHNIPTVGILAHGLSTLYPAAHKNISKEMCQSGGALLTEFISTTTPDRPNFVRRNRIVAGMADATIVVESPLDSGSLITAELANAYNRDVFAFPGRSTDIYSQGCNKLIKSNKANLIEGIEDIEYLLGWDIANQSKPVQTSLFSELNKDEQLIYNLLQEHKELYIDQICALSAMPVSAVSVLMVNLEFAGLIRCLPGKLYRLN